MKYRSTVILRDGRVCVIRHAEPEDAADTLRSFRKTHEETDYLTTYPEEKTTTCDEERRYLQAAIDSADVLELVAELDGQIVATAGIAPRQRRKKTAHRADMGISVEKAYWHLGIGRALMKALIQSAGEVGYLQLELEVVGENEKAMALYRKMGFVEYGRNPLGFRKKNGEWQELVSMRKEL